MTVPRRHADIQRGELRRILQSTWRPESADSRESTIGAWEKAFARYLGRKYALAVGSGRLAMKVILKSLRLEEGSEVILPAYTLKDLIPIIHSLGLIAVPADIDPLTFNINLDSVSKRLTGQTKCILATHLFGNPCPMKELMGLIQTHKLEMIEDCAHSAGASMDSKRTGAFGLAAFFSFEVAKPINTYGGGMIVTDDDSLAQNARMEIARLQSPGSILQKVCAAYLERFLFSTGLVFLPLFLFSSKITRKMMTSVYRSIQHAPGVERRYSGLQSTLGSTKIRTLNDRLRERRARAEDLKARLPGAVQPQRILPEAEPNYYFFVALLPEDSHDARRYLLSHGFDAGIGSEVADDCAKALGYTDCPQVEQVFKRAIHLPLHEGMTDRQIQRLARLLQDRYS